MEGSGSPILCETLNGDGPGSITRFAKKSRPVSTEPTINKYENTGTRNPRSQQNATPSRNVPQQSQRQPVTLADMGAEERLYRNSVCFIEAADNRKLDLQVAIGRSLVGR